MERRLKSKLPNGEFVGVTLERSRIMSAIRGKSNKTTEVRLRMALVRHGIAGWTLRPGTLQGNPDFFFPKPRVAIFVDGCFWHCCPRCGHTPKTRSQFWSAKLERNKQRDRLTSRLLKKMGVHVIRIWEHDLSTSNGTVRAVEMIDEATSRRRGQ
jgi:DNA mismatch endonuclease (patch repair protein)